MKGLKNPIFARWFLLPPLCAILIYTVGFGISVSPAFRTPTAVTVTDASSGEMLTVKDGSHAVLLDFSDGRYRGFANALSSAKESGITEWEALVLTHYHTREIASVARFCRENKVTALYLPSPQNDTDENILGAILSRIDTSQTDAFLYESEVSLPTATFSLSERYYLERSVQPIYYATLTAENETVLYMTQAIAETPLYEKATKEDAAVFIYSSDGPSPQSFVKIPPSSFTENRLILSYGTKFFPFLHSESKASLSETENRQWLHDKTPYVIRMGEK